MVEFAPIKNRDANQVIRGYVYQADLTIERWLELAPGQVLQLECGEDIDTISSAWRDRLLEQVKYRESTLTLRSKEALKSLACATATLRSNQDISLTFRYTTNAKVTVERPPIFDRRTPAIEMWEKIRTGHLGEAEQQQAIEKIKSLLVNAAKPQNVGSDIWQEFMDFIGSVTSTEFLGFIKTFEWSTGCIQASEMKPRIESILITTNRATGRQEAEIKYQRLFLYVFKLLCQQGAKRLTPAALEEQLALPTLSTQDEETLEYIQNILTSLEKRMSVMEKAVETMHPVLNKLAKDHGLDALDAADIQYAPIEPIIDIPPLVAHASKRKETISQIADELKDHTWITMKGTVGMGKTQLAILLVQQVGNCRAWICFRDKEKEVACNYFDRSIELMAGYPIPVNGKSRFGRACEVLNAGDLIVLDDIPMLSNNQDLSTRLLLFMEECVTHGIKIVSTGTLSPPIGFCNSAGDSLKVLDVPPFTEAETNEVLVAHGATSQDAKNWSSAVTTLASGHPVLIVAIARYLRDVSWRISIEQFDSLFFKQDYANAVNTETIRRLLDTVEDPDCRELLYRLNLVVYSFTTGDAKAVASIEPSVQRPNEKLTLLDGLWIQRMSSDSYMVSPLVKRLGSGDLPPQRQKAINYVLGLGVLARRHLNQWDAFSAVNYFLKAETYQNAMLVLMRALFAIAEQEEISDDACLGFIWKDTPLPPDTDMGLRIFLRSLQLAVNRRLGRDVKILYTDLVNLIEAAELEDCWSLFHATFEIIRYTEAYGDNWNSVHKAISKSIVSFPDAIVADGTKLASICAIGPEKFIWLVVPNITKPEQLTDWMEMVASLPTQAIQKAFEGQDADEACFQLSHAVWLSEAKKQEDSQDWDSVIAAFVQIARKADELALTLLWACARRAQMIILNEYVGDFNAALALAKETLARRSSDSRIQYLMYEYIGHDYYHSREYEQARLWLEEAAKRDVKLNPMGRLRTFAHLSAMVGQEDPVKALDLIRTAYEIAQDNQQVPESDLVRVLSEQAIAHWIQTGNVSAAFPAFDEAGEHLFACREDNIFWKALLVRYTHAAVYFRSLASRQQPPRLSDGEVYAKPFRGMFFVLNDEALSSRFREESVWILMAELAGFAAAVQNDKRAADWALRSLDVAKSRSQPQALIVLADQLIPYLLGDNRYAQVLDMALDASYAGIAVRELSKNKDYVLDLSFDVTDVLGAKPNDLWNEAEKNSAVIGLLPSTFRILTTSLEDREFAETHANQVATLCKQVRTGASLPELWKLSSGIFLDAFSEAVSAEDLTDKGNQCRNSHYDVLAVIAYMFASLKSDYRVTSRAYAQLAAMPYVHGASRGMPSVYRLLILPFLSKYWLKKIKEGKFLFSNPNEIEESLEQAGSISEEDRAQHILKTVARGLGLRLRKDMKKWLYGEKPQSESQNDQR